MDESGPGVGHNSGGIAAGQLKSFVDRIENLADEKQALADDIRDVFAEAKGQGFDTKTLRRIIRERKKSPAVRAEEEALFDLYAHALGIFG